MRLEEKANNHVDLQYPMGVEREYPIEDFKCGYLNCISEAEKITKANPKMTAAELVKMLKEGV